MAEILRYTGDLIRTADEGTVDPSRLGDCPRCGLPVIAGKKGFGCSGWKDGCRFTLFREYRGLVLDDAQIRELIQRRVLSRPVPLEGTGESLLQLSESGALMDVPVPAAAPRRFGGRAGSRAASGSPGPKRLRRKGKATAAAKSPEARPPTFTAAAVGACPLCGSEVAEGPKSFGCSGWKNGCGFTIWKRIAGKTISVSRPRGC